MSAIQLRGTRKTYAQYERVADRLLEAVTGRRRHREFVALEELDLVVEKGEVLGLVGMNGAGKSTLLKLISGTILPTSGTVVVDGHLSALLELGAGFHPEMTGRENVYLSGAIMGLNEAQMDALYESIVAFSGLEEFMSQPVKTYSSGMFVRLAFAVATCVQPDILIVDEALSVGDGAFARKSFDRIMAIKETGGTILFCSHSLYQIEAICTRVLWIHHGKVIMDGEPAVIAASYSEFLETGLLPHEERAPVSALKEMEAATTHHHGTKIRQISITADGHTGKELSVECNITDFVVTVEFISDPKMPAPSIALAFVRPDGSLIASAGTLNDGIQLSRKPDGAGEVSVTFPRLPLLKGEYWINAYLLCEQGIHIYDQATMAAKIKVTQKGLEQGLVSLPHHWRQPIAMQA